MDNQNNRFNKPQIGPYQKGVQKALLEAGQQHTLEALSQGVPPQHIEQQAGFSKQELLNQLVSLSQVQVPTKPQGESGLMSGGVGLIGALINASQGKGFNPFAQKTEPMGLNSAIALQGTLQSGQEGAMKAEKFPFEMEKLLSEVVQAPLQQQKLQTEVAKSKQELRQMQPGFQEDKLRREEYIKSIIPQENKVREDYNKQIEPFIRIRDSWNDVKELSQAEPSGTNDLAIAYAALRAWSPDAVREGELKNLKEAQSKIQNVMNIPARTVGNGQLFSPETRAALINSVRTKFNASGKQYGELTKRYVNQVIAYGGDPHRALVSQFGGGKSSNIKSIKEIKPDA